MRTARVLAMNSSTSLWRQVCPHRCFIPGRSRLREFHPLTRSSPPCSEATNQWFVCFFSVAQMSHDIACRITASPPVRTVFPRIQLALHIRSRRSAAAGIGRRWPGGQPDLKTLVNRLPSLHRAFGGMLEMRAERIQQCVRSGQGNKHGLKWDTPRAPHEEDGRARRFPTHFAIRR